MRPKLYELNTQKMVEFTTKTVKNDPNLLKNREFLQLIIAPMALVQFGIVFYIVTQNMDPQDAEERWKFEGIDAGISLPVHVVFAGDDGKPRWDPTPAFGFATTPRELIAEYSTPSNVYWFTPEARKNWAFFFSGLDRKEES